MYRKLSHQPTVQYLALRANNDRETFLRSFYASKEPLDLHMALETTHYLPIASLGIVDRNCGLPLLPDTSLGDIGRRDLLPMTNHLDPRPYFKDLDSFLHNCEVSEEETQRKLSQLKSLYHKVDDPEYRLAVRHQIAKYGLIELALELIKEGVPAEDFLIPAAVNHRPEFLMVLFDRVDPSVLLALLIQLLDCEPTWIQRLVLGQGESNESKKADPNLVLHPTIKDPSSVIELIRLGADSQAARQILRGIPVNEEKIENETRNLTLKLGPEGRRYHQNELIKATIDVLGHAVIRGEWERVEGYLSSGVKLETFLPHLTWLSQENLTELKSRHLGLE